MIVKYNSINLYHYISIHHFHSVPVEFLLSKNHDFIKDEKFSYPMQDYYILKYDHNKEEF